MFSRGTALNEALWVSMSTHLSRSALRYIYISMTVSDESVQ
jgi:hypothetical protein